MTVTQKPIMLLEGPMDYVISVQNIALCQRLQMSISGGFKQVNTKNIMTDHEEEIMRRRQQNSCVFTN